MYDYDVAYEKKSSFCIKYELTCLYRGEPFKLSKKIHCFALKNRANKLAEKVIYSIAGYISAYEMLRMQVKIREELLTKIIFVSPDQTTCEVFLSED